MDLLRKFPLQFLLLVYVQVRLFNGIEYPVGDLWIVKVRDFISTVFIVQGNCGSVLYRALKVIYRDVPAEGPLGDIIVGHQRSACKADS